MDAKEKESAIDRKMNDMLLDEDTELSTTALMLLKRKESKLFTPKDLMARIMRSKVKDSIFNEQVHTHQ